MKRLIRSVALVSALVAGTALAPAQAQWMGYGGNYWGENEIGWWESDNWATDEFGYYDRDFLWETTDNAWGTWYGDAYNAWNDYDDFGDEGWFDV